MDPIPFAGKVSLFSQFSESANLLGPSKEQLKLQWSSCTCLLWWVPTGDLRLAYEILHVNCLPYGGMGSGREEQPHRHRLQKCALWDVLGFPVYSLANSDTEEHALNIFSELKRLQVLIQNSDKIPIKLYFSEFLCMFWHSSHFHISRIVHIAREKVGQEEEEHNTKPSIFEDGFSWIWHLFGCCKLLIASQCFYKVNSASLWLFFIFLW